SFCRTSLPCGSLPRGSLLRRSEMRWGRADIPNSVERLAEFRQGIVGGHGFQNRAALGPGLDQIQANPLQAAMFELQHLGGVVGKIDNTAGNDRAAVVYFDYHRSSVAQVCHPHVASQG